MDELLKKLSSYNLLNNLLPGVVFALLGSSFTKYSLIQSDIVAGVFLYYFFGLVISRIGSLVVEPVLEWSRFIEYSDYRDYIVASGKDEKIGVLLETNNTYRTFASLLVSLLMLKLFGRLETIFPVLVDWRMFIAVLVLLVIFLFSYRKQTAYIVKRVEQGITTRKARSIKRKGMK
jgi:hypothetical protein